MRLLVDTHVYAWWVIAQERLSRRAADALASSGAEIMLSAVVVWELTIKWRLGKWPDAEPVLADIETALREERLTPLPIGLDHARRAGLIDSPHRDPFDRLLLAQAEIEGAALISADPALARLGPAVIW